MSTDFLLERDLHLQAVGDTVIVSDGYPVAPPYIFPEQLHEERQLPIFALPGFDLVESLLESGKISPNFEIDDDSYTRLSGMVKCAILPEWERSIATIPELNNDTFVRSLDILERWIFGDTCVDAKGAYYDSLPVEEKLAELFCAVRIEGFRQNVKMVRGQISGTERTTYPRELGLTEDEYKDFRDKVIDIRQESRFREIEDQMRSKLGRVDEGTAEKTCEKFDEILTNILNGPDGKALEEYELERKIRYQETVDGEEIEETIIVTFGDIARNLRECIFERRSKEEEQELAGGPVTIAKTNAYVFAVNCRRDIELSEETQQNLKILTNIIDNFLLLKEKVNHLIPETVEETIVTFFLLNELFQGEERWNVLQRLGFPPDMGRISINDALEHVQTEEFGEFGGINSLLVNIGERTFGEQVAYMH